MRLVRFLLATVVGTLLRESSGGPTLGSTDPNAVARRQRELEASGLPALVRAASELSFYDQDADYVYAMEALIELVVARSRAWHPRPLTS